jgi:glycolate oxidase iron-sulfur subunit
LNAVCIVAKKNGIELIVPKEFKCCAIAHLSAGDVESFRQNALYNLELIPDDVDYVLFDCASCHRAFGLYDELFGSKRTKELKKKFVHINNFLAEQEIYIPENVEFNKVVNEHIPCHLSDKESIRKVAAKMPFIKDFNADETGLCCGAAGLFCVENGKISLEISAKKASILSQNADVVLTSCASCTMGLLQGFASLGKNVEIYNPVELLAEKYLLEEESFM